MAFDVGAIGEPLDEREPGDLVAEMIDLLETAMPEWVARNGSNEVIYAEAVALAVADVVNTGNDVIAAVEEAILEDLYLVPRGAGTQANGELTVTFDSVVTTTIPVGSTFALPDYGVELQASAAVDVTATDTAVVAVVTTEPTSSVNGVDDPTPVDVLDVIPNALSVVISSPMVNGADPEDDAAYVARARNRLARVTNSLVVNDHFTAWCLESGLASNATTIGAWDGAAIGTAGTDACYVSSAVYGFGGAVSNGNKTTLAAEMQAITAAGVTVAVVDASLETVAVTATVAALADTDTATVKAAVEAALTAYLDPEVWEFGDTVRTTSLTALIAGVEGVDYVDSLDAPATDVTLTADQVADCGTLTITVT